MLTANTNTLGKEVDTMKQKFTSANTSINKTKAPAIYNMKKAIELMTNKSIIDIGGGKYDTAIEKAKEYNAAVSIYDAYNRSTEHNNKVLSNNNNRINLLHLKRK